MAKVTKEAVMEALKDVFDPEIPVNVVDLGLVYDVNILEGDKVHVKMTLTFAGCPMHEFLSEDAREKVIAGTGATDAEVEIVWEPPWTPELITEDGRKALGWA